MADPWTDAWAEAEATNPPVLTYDTLEIVHPALPTVIRVVSGAPDDVSLTIELGADNNPGEVVSFQAVEFRFERPELSQGRVPQCKVTIDNVGQIISPYMEDAVKMRANLTLTYRQYRADDTTEPCYGPVTFKVKQVNVKDTQLTGTAMLEDLSNRKFPNKVYTFNEYPGLISA